MIKMSTKIKKALELAQSESPNETIKQAFKLFVTIMIKEGENENTIIRQILAATLAGMAYGNWPGIKP